MHGIQKEPPSPSERSASFPGCPPATVRRSLPAPKVLGANNAFRNQAGASQYSRSNPQYSAQRSRKSSKGKKIALGVCCALIVALIGCGTAFAVWYNNVNSQLNTGGKTSEELESINEQLVNSSFNEPFYMMLIGSDQREGDDEGGARSDTNIVVASTRLPTRQRSCPFPATP